jgi:hypothetical protein
MNKIMIDIICQYCDKRTSHIDVYLYHVRKEHKQERDAEKKALQNQNVDELIQKHLSDPLNMQALNQLLHQPNPMGNIQFDDLMEELEKIKAESNGIRRINTKIKRSFPAPNTTNNDIVIDIDIDDKSDPSTMNKVIQNIYSKINNQNTNGLPANTKINNINGNQISQVDPSVLNDPNNPLAKIFGGAFAGLFGNASNNGNVSNNGSVAVYNEKDNPNAITTANVSANQTSSQTNNKNNSNKNTKQNNSTNLKTQNNKYKPESEHESEHDSDAENYGRPSKKNRRALEEEEEEETHYGEFLFENTEHCPDNNIHSKDLYDAFEKWYKEKFPHLVLPERKEFIKNIKEFHTVHNSVKSNGKFSSGLKNLRLK